MKSYTLLKFNKYITSKAHLFFILPSFIGICLFILIPFLDVIRRSFTSSVQGTFQGFNNYLTVLHNHSFQLASWNTLKFSMLCIPLLVIFSLLLALLVHSAAQNIPFFKTIFLVPLAIPVASITLLWQVLLHRQGVLNGFLLPWHIGVDWMNSEWSFWVLVTSYIWKNIGYDMILWLAGLCATPDAIYEAAAVDGANKLQTFIYITLPNLLPILYTITVLSLLNSFKVFREAYLIAGNYPHEDIYLLQHLFNNWFLQLDMDKLTAGAVLMSFVILILIMVLKKLWEQD